MTGNQIVATEEVRDSLAREFNGSARPDEVADDLAISVSTARRHLELLVDRGWAIKGRTTHRAMAYTLTARGLEASEQNEGW